MGIYARFRHQNTHGHLFAAHFQAEYAAHVAALGRVHADVQRQAALAQAGPRAHNEHIGTLHPAQQAVQVAVTALQRRQVGEGYVADVALQVHVQHRPQRNETPFRVGRLHAEQHVHRLTHGVFGVSRILKPDFGDAAAGVNDAPLGGGVGDDAGVVLHVHRRGSFGD